jgi:hypothetical protein
MQIIKTMNQFEDNYYQERLNLSMSEQPFDNSSILTNDNTDEKNDSIDVFSNSYNNNDLTTKKRIVLSENDLVVLTPVRRIEDIEKKINHQHICSHCYHRLNKKVIYDHICQDVKLFGFILQLFISFFVITLLFINVYLTLVNTFSSSINDENGYKLTLKKCHITLLVLNFFIINITTLILNCFDLKQSRKLGSFRVSYCLLVFIEWTGGWMIKWIFMVYLYLTKDNNSSYLKQRFSFLQLSVTTLFSIAGPFTYLIFNSFLNE